MKNLKRILRILPFLLMVNIFLLVGVGLCRGETAVENKKPSAATTSYALPKTKGKLVLKEGNFDNDPDKELFLANRFFSLIIEPLSGGVISKISYRGMDINAEPNYGILSDHVTSQP